jgi:RimJ/RimL family protein N-acetyltransferase
MAKFPSPRESKKQAALAASSAAPAAIVTTDWRKGLPELDAPGYTLRELRVDDAGSLMALLTAEEVSRFISPPPATLDGFVRFIIWTHRERVVGQQACFAVVPDGMDTAIGLFQLRSLDARFATGEWGFAVGSPFWGSGAFIAGATAVLEFAFGVIGVERLEARAVVQNGRGNGALRKIGAVQEGVLRRSFWRRGQYYDQVLWSILAEDWRAQRAQPPDPRLH